MTTEIGLHFVSILTQAAARSGSDLRAVLVALDMRVHTREGREERLPLSLLVSLFEQLEARSRHGRFVFALADAFNFDDQPAISALLASAHDLRQLLQLLYWVPEVIHPAIAFSEHEDQALMHIRPEVRSSDPRLKDHPLLIELMTAVTLRLVKRIAPDLPLVERIHFCHEPAGALAVYEAYFACPVLFKAEKNAMIGSLSQFEQPLPGSLPQAFEQAEETVRIKILGDGIIPSIHRQAEQLLRLRLSLLGEGLSGLAKAMQLHPRRLQRELKAVQTSYAELLAQARYERARAMLRDMNLDIESIALKLGFNERRSFTLAFKHWQGMSPSQYRQHIKQQKTGARNDGL